MQLYRRLRQLCARCANQIKDTNTFESVPPSDDSSVLKNQKISTWLFIFLLISSVAVLLFYNALVPVQKTFTVQQPTYDKYLTLFSKYPNELQCPCKTVSVIYDRFIQVNYSLHYICSSFLVSEQWAKKVSVKYFGSAYRHDDFRATSDFAFQGLRSFCQLTEETLQNSLSSFYSNQYVSAYLTPSDLFRQQNEAHIQQFISSTIKIFLSALSLIRETTQANAQLSGMQTNYDAYMWGGYTPLFYGVEYSGCSCTETVSCVAPSVVYNKNRNSVLFTVPGFYSGCFIIEALLFSNFQCFHDEQCFNNLTFYVDSTLKLNATILNASLSTKFTANSTVREMVDKLMVEQWKWNITFAKYYDECEPSQCTYTIGSRNGVLFIVTTVFGLVGGLVTILRIIVPRLIDYMRSKRGDDKTETGEFLWENSHLDIELEKVVSIVNCSHESKKETAGKHRRRSVDIKRSCCLKWFSQEYDGKENVYTLSRAAPVHNHSIFLSIAFEDDGNLTLMSCSDNSKAWMSQFSILNFDGYRHS